jgi:hypothetical protein
MTPEQSASLKSIWEEQNKWSQAADRLKQQVQTARLGTAILSLLGAFLATLASVLAQMNGGTWQVIIAAAGAVCLAIAPLILRAGATAEHIKTWTRTRAAAEALNAQIYRFLAGGPPYGSERPPDLLLHQRDEVVDGFKDIIPIIAIQVKALPELLTIDGYIDQRVQGQEKYFVDNAVKHKQRADRFNYIVLILTWIAAALGAITAYLGQWASLIGPWVSVMTTAGAAIAAHAAAERYAMLATTYSATAGRLKSLREEFSIDKNRNAPERIEQFISDCEGALSAENGGWVAEWSRKPDQG